MKRSTGYAPEWDINVEEGDIGEALIAEMLTGLIESKRKSYRDLKLYVEQEHDPGRRGRYVPSGLSTTQAQYWAYVIDNSGIAVFIPVMRLRQAINAGNGQPKAETDGDCPTRGRLLALPVLLNPRLDTT